mmetsp:Transcript_38025/g.80516  ORF Transcript_38025/g.80516 Transcript_38025/m.80516 type:complete len:263 (-) Transcript_38025:75-863(-)|eukprot:CAMPEP_0206493416 /NCGR_PEP_ID=MMETSP0324_2-20121206/46943_1 /ASSEMBLY_ACC=CAM_ASM_000836 /TAXON_ID=2866 /ORGANISM="Crypthecodinium cohnii, Strain Seligo" /LENGTH=262 /DNA_ID=CAMNT_0053976523 /DNA_START=80 /DNA_END=868 /DNA_ORIENTATION=-
MDRIDAANDDELVRFSDMRCWLLKLWRPILSAEWDALVQRPACPRRTWLLRATSTRFHALSEAEQRSLKQQFVGVPADDHADEAEGAQPPEALVAPERPADPPANVNEQGDMDMDDNDSHHDYLPATQPLEAPSFLFQKVRAHVELVCALWTLGLPAWQLPHNMAIADAHHFFGACMRLVDKIEVWPHDVEIGLLVLTLVRVVVKMEVQFDEEQESDCPVVPGSYQQRLCRGLDVLCSFDGWPDAKAVHAVEARLLSGMFRL